MAASWRKGPRVGAVESASTGFDYTSGGSVVALVGGVVEVGVSGREGSALGGFAMTETRLEMLVLTAVLVSLDGSVAEG